MVDPRSIAGGKNAPSKIRTAVGKSLTLLAALRAAMMTDGEGTRSYAKALFKFLCSIVGQKLFCSLEGEMPSWSGWRVSWEGKWYLELENILNTVEFLLVSV